MGGSPYDKYSVNYHGSDKIYILLTILCKDVKNGTKGGFNHGPEF